MWTGRRGIQPHTYLRDVTIRLRAWTERTSIVSPDAAAAEVSVVLVPFALGGGGGPSSQRSAKGLNPAAPPAAAAGDGTDGPPAVEASVGGAPKPLVRQGSMEFLLRMALRTGTSPAIIDPLRPPLPVGRRENNGGVTVKTEW